MSDTELECLGEAELKVSFGDFKPLVKYSLKSLTKTSNTFNGKVIDGMKAVVIDDDDIEFTTYLPKSFSNLSDAMVQRINTAVELKKPYFVVLYGKVKLANMAKIHKHGEEIDMAYYKKVQKLGEMSNGTTSSASSGKRTLSSDDGPDPKVKKE